MKARQPHTLSPRKTMKGTVVWYFQMRDASSRRLPAKRTGCETKTDAMNQDARRLKAQEAGETANRRSRSGSTQPHSYQYHLSPKVLILVKTRP